MKKVFNIWAGDGILGQEQPLRLERVASAGIFRAMLGAIVLTSQITGNATGPEQRSLTEEVSRMDSDKELGIIRPTFYFQCRGEINTWKVLELARERALELGITKMVLASETGRSALKALEALKGTEIRLLVVTHYPGRTWGPKGDIPIGLTRPEYVHVKRFLEKHKAIVVQGTRPLGGIGRSLGWDAPVPATFVDKALELFGAGTKIAIEAALMATDAGALDPGQESVTLAGTYKGLDTALIVRTSYSGSFFSEFEVLEVVAKPRCPGRRLPEYAQEGWKGNLDQYYGPIQC